MALQQYILPLVSYVHVRWVGRSVGRAVLLTVRIGSVGRSEQHLSRPASTQVGLDALASQATPRLTRPKDVARQWLKIDEKGCVQCGLYTYFEVGFQWPLRSLGDPA